MATKTVRPRATSSRNLGVLEPPSQQKARPAPVRRGLGGMLSRSRSHRVLGNSKKGGDEMSLSKSHHSRSVFTGRDSLDDMDLDSCVFHPDKKYEDDDTMGPEDLGFSFGSHERLLEKERQRTLLGGNASDDEDDSSLYTTVEKPPIAMSEADIQKAIEKGQQLAKKEDKDAPVSFFNQVKQLDMKDVEELPKRLMYSKKSFASRQLSQRDLMKRQSSKRGLYGSGNIVSGMPGTMSGSSRQPGGTVISGNTGKSELSDRKLSRAESRRKFAQSKRASTGGTIPEALQPLPSCKTDTTSRIRRASTMTADIPTYSNSNSKSSSSDSNGNQHKTPPTQRTARGHVKRASAENVATAALDTFEALNVNIDRPEQAPASKTTNTKPSNSNTASGIAIDGHIPVVVKSNKDALLEKNFPLSKPKGVSDADIDRAFGSPAVFEPTRKDRVEEAFGSPDAFGNPLTKPQNLNVEPIEPALAPVVLPIGTVPPGIVLPPGVPLDKITYDMIHPSGNYTAPKEIVVPKREALREGKATGVSLSKHLDIGGSKHRRSSMPSTRGRGIHSERHADTGTITSVDTLGVSTLGFSQSVHTSDRMHETRKASGNNDTPKLPSTSENVSNGNTSGKTPLERESLRASLPAMPKRSTSADVLPGVRAQARSNNGHGPPITTTGRRPIMQKGNSMNQAGFHQSLTSTATTGITTLTTSVRPDPSETSSELSTGKNKKHGKKNDRKGRDKERDEVDIEDKSKRKTRSLSRTFARKIKRSISRTVRNLKAETQDTKASAKAKDEKKKERKSQKTAKPSKSGKHKRMSRRTSTGDNSTNDHGGTFQDNRSRRGRRSHKREEVEESSSGAAFDEDVSYSMSNSTRDTKPITNIQSRLSRSSKIEMGEF